MKRRKFAMVLIVGSLLTWVLEKSSQQVSTAIGKLRCGDRYMQAVDGIVGDPSCGFNDDLYIASLLLILLLSGFVLYITAKKD